MDVFGITVPTWLILITLLLLLLYLYGTRTHDAFIKMGIPGPKPWPLLGNIPAVFGQGVTHFDKAVIQKYGNVVGLFEFGRPLVLVADLDMLRQIMVKEFNHFPNRRVFFDSNPPFNKFLTVLKDGDWKRVRSLMTPALSSGKIRAMTEPVNDCADILIECIKDKIKEGKDVLPLRDTYQAFTMDVIARTAFGVDVNSQKNPDDVFVTHAKNIFGGIKWVLIIILIYPQLLIWICKYTGVKLLPTESLNFFVKIVHKLVEERKIEKPVQTDFLQLMMNAHEHAPDKADINEDKEAGFTWDEASVKNKKGMTLDELTAQCVLFFSAGSDTTATTLNFLCYNMAVYPDLQERLVQEIEDVIGTEETVTQEMYQKLTYLDMCICETLRIYPVTPRVDRVCKKEITIKNVTFPEDCLLNVPIYAIHHDPKHWPDPDTFNPERFTPEAKAERDPMTWLPFGFGPRNCIGMRLAQMELKIAAVKIFRNFIFSKCDQTEMPPLKIKKGVLLLQTARPLVLKIQTRHE